MIMVTDEEMMVIRCAVGSPIVWRPDRGATVSGLGRFHEEILNSLVRKGIVCLWCNNGEERIFCITRWSGEVSESNGGQNA